MRAWTSLKVTADAIADFLWERTDTLLRIFRRVRRKTIFALETAWVPKMISSGKKMGQRNSALPLRTDRVAIVRVRALLVPLGVVNLEHHSECVA